jgi:tetratricopeptide (TPR) repeat protein
VLSGSVSKRFFREVLVRVPDFNIFVPLKQPGMARKIPVIRNTCYSCFIAQIAILLFIILVLFFLNVTHYLILGISLYFLLSIYLKVLIPKWHRKGIFYLKKGELQAAILAFQKSYDYFQKNSWIDQYRAFTLFSTSQLSYSEMALMNIVFCYEQLGDKKSARKYLAILRKQFPDNKYSQ